VNPPRQGMESLDLNDGAGWAGMEAYEGILRSGPEGSHRASTPMRVPPRRSLNFQPPHSAGGGGAGEGTRGRATSEAVGGARVPPLPHSRGSTSAATGGSRGCTRRHRGAGPAMGDDILEPIHATPASHVPVDFLNILLFLIPHAQCCLP
jgi:hypothetical protein